MRNAERLVKVQVADIGPEIRQRAMADQRVQVRPVDIDLAAGLMTMSHSSAMDSSNTPWVDG